MMNGAGTEFVTLRLEQELFALVAHRPRSCIAWAACCTGCSRPSFSRPSMVVTGLPTAALTGIWQERRGAPPISTVQAPHWPSPQPYLLPVKPSSSRRTYSRGVSGSYCTGYRLPFTSISIALGIVSPILPPFGPGSVLVASVTGSFGVIQFVTAQAAVHGDDAGDFRHGVHLAHRAMARFAFHARGQMRAVRPRNAGQNGVAAQRRNRFLRFGEGGELLNRRSILDDRDVAFHTLAGGREGHQFTGFRIGVAILAFEAEGEMFLVAVGDGLLGSGVLGGIIGNHLLRGRWRGLLRGEP